MATSSYRFKELWLYWSFLRHVNREGTSTLVNYTDQITLTYGILLDDPEYPELVGSQRSIEIKVDNLPSTLLANLHAACNLTQENIRGGRQVELPGGLHAPPSHHVTQLTYHVRSRRADENGTINIFTTLVTPNSMGGGPPISILPGASGAGFSPKVVDALRNLCSSGDSFFHDKALENLGAEYSGLPFQPLDTWMQWVFLAYRSIPRDEDFARRLARAIEERLTLKAWFFPWQTKLGDSIPASINAGLGRCKVGVIVYSPEFFEGAWADHEYERLITDQIKGRKIVIGAILAGDPGGFPEPADVRVYADFRDPDRFDDEFRKLYRGILGKPLEDRPV